MCEIKYLNDICVTFARGIRLGILCITGGSLLVNTMLTTFQARIAAAVVLMHKKNGVENIGFFISVNGATPSAPCVTR